MYFINVGSSLANNIHSKSNPLLYVQSTDKCMAIPEVHLNEVNTIISAMKKSASGYDELSTSILKQCIDSYITPLTCLIIYISLFVHVVNLFNGTFQIHKYTVIP